MTLRELQSIFALCSSRLIQRAFNDGLQATWGEAWRSEWEAARLAKLGLGIKRSVHCDRLAVDINLFRWDGVRWVYCTDTHDYEPLGVWWEAQHTLARWGGRFTRPDGNHFSFEWEGRA